MYPLAMDHLGFNIFQKSKSQTLYISCPIKCYEKLYRPQASVGHGPPRFLYFFKAKNHLIWGKTRVFLVQIFWHSEKKKTISTTIGNMLAAVSCLSVDLGPLCLIVVDLRRNKLAKLGDAIAISKCETINH